MPRIKDWCDTYHIGSYVATGRIKSDSDYFSGSKLYTVNVDHCTIFIKFQ